MTNEAKHDEYAKIPLDAEQRLEILNGIVNEDSNHGIMWLAVIRYVETECPCWECLIISIRDAQKELGV